MHADDRNCLGAKRFVHDGDRLRLRFRLRYWDDPVTGRVCRPLRQRSLARDRARPTRDAWANLRSAGAARRRPVTGTAPARVDRYAPPPEAAATIHSARGRMTDGIRIIGMKASRTAALSRSGFLMAGANSSTGTTSLAAGCGRTCSPANRRWNRPGRSRGRSGTRAPRLACRRRLSSRHAEIPV